jgi:hypothetical protein
VDPFSQIVLAVENRFDHLVGGREALYSLGSRKAKESIPGKGGEKRWLAMEVGS